MNRFQVIAGTALLPLLLAGCPSTKTLCSSPEVVAPGGKCSASYSYE